MNELGPMNATAGRRIVVSGQLVELWENPDVPFSCSREALARYVAADDWVSVFNALMLRLSPARSE